MRDKIAKALREACEANHCDGPHCDECCTKKANAVLALGVPVWCDFYGKKCMNDLCSISAKPETCHHKSSVTIAALIEVK